MTTSRSMRRGFTLVEVLISSMITAMVALAVVGLLQMVSVMASGQENRVSAVVRLSGIQARVARLALEARMFLEQRADRVALWLPSEMIEGASSGSENNFDTINLDEDEIVWLLWEETSAGSWRLLEQRPDPDALDLVALEITNLDVYFTADGQYWDSIYTWLQEQGALDTRVLADDLIAPRLGAVLAEAPTFQYSAPGVCDNRWFAGEYAFADDEAPVNARFDAAIAFPDPHPLCGDGS